MWACLTQRNSLSSHNWTANIQNVSAEISVQQLVMCFPVEEMCKVFPLFWVCYWWRWRILLGMFCHNKLLWRFVRDNVHVGHVTFIACSSQTKLASLTNSTVVTCNARAFFFWLVDFTYFADFTYSVPPADQSPSQTVTPPVLLETGWLFGTADIVQWCLWKCKSLAVSRGISCFRKCRMCNIWGEKDKTAAFCVFVFSQRDVFCPYLREFWYPLLKTLQWLVWCTQLFRRNCVG